MTFKKIIAAALATATFAFGTVASAEENPTCILMKFTDETPDSGAKGAVNK